MHEQDGGIKLIQRDLIMGLSPQRDRTQIEAIISKMKLNFYYTILKPDAKREEREDSKYRIISTPVWWDHLSDVLQIFLQTC